MNEIDQDHHPFGPSGYGVHALCSASYQMSDGERAPANEAQERGLRLHGHMREGDDPEDEFEQFLVERARQNDEELDARAGIAEEPDLEVRRELRLGPADIPDIPPALWPWGTLDRLAVSERHMRGTIIDYKFGSAPLNETLALAQLEEQAWLALRFETRIDRVLAAVSQPENNLLATAEFTSDQIGELSRRIARTIKASLDPKAVPTPSAFACPRCDGRARCPAVGAELAVIERLERIEDLDETELGDLFSRAKRAEAVVDLMKDGIRSLLLEGRRADGWKIVEYTRAKIRELRPVADLLHSVGARWYEIIEARGSVGKLRRLYAEKAGLTYKEGAAVFNNLCGSFIEDTPQVSVIADNRRKEIP